MPFNFTGWYSATLQPVKRYSIVESRGRLEGLATPVCSSISVAQLQKSGSILSSRWSFINSKRFKALIRCVYLGTIIVLQFSVVKEMSTH